MITVVNVTAEQVLAARVQVADTIGSRLRGLIGRQLAPEEGLLLTPCRAVHTLFMRQPIDVIFLDSEHHIVHVIPAMAPWRLSRSVGQARSVLELYPGTTERTGTVVGHQLKFESVPE